MFVGLKHSFAKLRRNILLYRARRNLRGQLKSSRKLLSLSDQLGISGRSELMRGVYDRVSRNGAYEEYMERTGHYAAIRSLIRTDTDLQFPFLDPSCGPGHLSLYFVKKAFLSDRSGMVYLSDYSHGMREQVALNLSSSVEDYSRAGLTEWHIGHGRFAEIKDFDITDIPLPDASISTLLCTQTLQLLPPEMVEKALQEFRRVVKRGGFVFLVEEIPHKVSYGGLLGEIGILVQLGGLSIKSRRAFISHVSTFDFRAIEQKEEIVDLFSKNVITPDRAHKIQLFKFQA